MRTYFFIEMLKAAVFSLLIVLPASSSAMVCEWEKLSDEDGIEVFKREIPGSPLIAFKGQGIVEAPISKVAQIIIDTKRSTEWMDSISEAIPLSHDGPLEYTDYTHMGTSILIKDREFVTHTKIEIDKQNQALIFKMKSVEHPDAPKTNYVRGKIVSSLFKIYSRDSGQKTFVEGELQADPMGDVPKWLVNIVQKSWPRNTLTALRKQAKRTDISENLYFKQVLIESVPVWPSR